MNVHSEKSVSVFKKTKKGKVIRSVKNEYLRSDIEFGVLNNKSLRYNDIVSLISVSVNKHVIIVSEDVCITEIDCWEYKLTHPLVVIIFQSVLQALKDINVSCYKRICSLLNDTNYRFIFYPNVLTTETNSSRMQNEDINNYHDKIILKGASYFCRVLNSVAEVYLISNKQYSCSYKHDQDMKLMTMRKYAQYFLAKLSPGLLDILSTNDDYLMTKLVDSDGAKSLFSFTPYAVTDDILLNLKTKKFFKGIIRCQDNDPNTCYVSMNVDAKVNSDSVHSSSKLIKIEGYANVNRAIDGDLVAIEILAPNNQMDIVDDSLINRILNPSLFDDNVNENVKIVETTSASDNDIQDELLSPAVSTNEKELNHSDVEQLLGKVVGIIRRNWRQYAGSLIYLDDFLAKISYHDDKINNFVKQLLKNNSFIQSKNNVMGEDDVYQNLDFMIFIPFNSKIPPVLVKTRFGSTLEKNRVIVAIDEWHSASLFPWGHYVKLLGEEGDTAVETQVLLHEFDISHESFSPEVMACLPPLDWKITSHIISQRLDLRHLPVVSIDPPGCKDIDDALHCIKLPNGNLQIGVHIADVTFFVQPDTALDKEASFRSTSTYLVERRLDMLPSYLTTELCSLRCNEDHLAFSVIWEMDMSGNINDVSFHKSVIHSVASLTYDQAQIILDDKSTIHDADNDVNYKIGESVKLLNHIAHLLRNKRLEMGALTLASPEIRFKIDSESHNPTDVSMYSLKESNALVEEFMLLANITVAKQTLKHFPSLSILRRHQAPNQSQFDELLEKLKIVGMKIDITSSKALASSLDIAHKENDTYFNKLLRILTTRCMKPANYFCSGEIPKELWHHYGLAAPVYTHFTSPIRRYADIIVHRLLAASIGVIPLTPSYADRSKQQNLCTHMNRKHKAAQYVQRASVNLHTLIYFKNRESSHEVAYVTSITSEKIIIFCPKFALEGSLDVTCIENEINCLSKFDEKDGILKFKSKSSNIVVFQLQVFQKCSITIKAGNNLFGKSSLDMKLVIDESTVDISTDPSNPNKKARIVM